MAVITANTGSNNWNTNAAWVGGVQPSATSDVVIPASAVVTIPAATTALGRSLTVQASGTLAFASTTAVLTLGDSTAGAGNVAISVSSSATITLTGTDAQINLKSTSATQQTITSGGKTLPSITINGAGSSYILGDALTMPTSTSTTTLAITAGTFNTANFAITGTIFNSNGSSARTLTLGSSAILLARNGTAMTFTSTGLTMTANTAVITCTATATISTSSVNMNGTSLVYTGAGMVALNASGGTWKNVTRTGTAAKTDGFIIGASFTCTGTFTVTSNSSVNRLLVVSGSIGTARTVTAAAVSLTDVDFKDIIGAGAAAPFTGTRLGNCLGNSGITFTVAAGTSNGGSGVNRYWVGGTQSWSTTTAWSTTDGGASGASVPLPQDDVYFTSNSMGGNSKTVTVDMQRIGRNIDWTGTTGTSNIFTMRNGLNQEFYGNWTLGGTIATNSTSGSGTLTACGRSSHTITSNGQTYYGPWEILAPGGTYTLQDGLITILSQVRQMTFTRGTFNANGFNMSHGLYSIVSTFTSLVMGSGTWTINRVLAASSWSQGASAGVISCGTSTIKYANQATGTQTFAGGGSTYYILDSTVAGTTGALNITGSNTFNTIQFSDASNARTLRFTAGTTTTVTNWTVNGTAGKLMTISSITAATHTLTKPSGTVSSNYLSLTNSIATGGAAWYAGANSTNVSGNTGWIFTAVPARGNFFEVF